MKFAPLVRLAGPFGLYSLGRQLSRSHPRILMYHRFSEQPQARSVSRAQFERQVEHIARHYNPMTMGQLLDRWRSGGRVEPNAVVITVDDGHADFLDIAWPVLRRYHVPATLFVATGFIDGELWLWPDQLRWLLESANPLPKSLTVGDFTMPVEGGEQAWVDLVDWLLSLPDRDKRAAIQELSSTLAVPLPTQPPPEYASVTWDQLRAMEREGLEVGGHTHTHPSLARVPVNRLPDETARCLARLTSELGPAPRPFCYPNGQPSDVTDDTRAAVEAAGFTGAVVAYADGTSHDDLYYLRRHGGSGEWDHFLKVVSGVEWLGWRMRGKRVT